MLLNNTVTSRGFTRRRCPKCGGNTYIDQDFYGWYEQCLQCGKHSDLPEIGKFSEHENAIGSSISQASRS